MAWARKRKGLVGLPNAEVRKPYVVCVGTSPEDTAAVAKSLAGRAVVVVASDPDVIRPLLEGGASSAPDEPSSDPAVELGGNTGRLTIDRMLRQVTWADQAIHLSPREFELLAMLAADTKRVWTFEEIVTTVWKTRYFGDTDMVFSVVKRLRRRLAAVMTDLRIVSVRGVGFRLVVPDHL